MGSRLRCFAYAILIILLLCSFPAIAKFPCERYQDFLKTAFQEGYGIAAIGAAEKGHAITLFLDRLGNFKIVGVDDDLNACTMISGSDFRALSEAPI